MQIKIISTDRGIKVFAGERQLHGIRSVIISPIECGSSVSAKIEFASVEIELQNVALVTPVSEIHAQHSQ